MDEPFANGGNGEAERDGHGRFLPGNNAAAGRGNPHAARVNAWRRALVESVSSDDLREVIGKLVERAKAGERWAVCELLDRCLGKPVQPTVTAGELEVCRILLEVDPGPMRISRDDA